MNLNFSGVLTFLFFNFFNKIFLTTLRVGFMSRELGDNQITDIYNIAEKLLGPFRQLFIGGSFESIVISHINKIPDQDHRESFMYLVYKQILNGLRTICIIIVFLCPFVVFFFHRDFRYNYFILVSRAMNCEVTSEVILNTQ